ncbi:MAG: hypothetical protein ACK4NZ_05620 [Tsuneonella sp.]
MDNSKPDQKSLSEEAMRLKTEGDKGVHHPATADHGSEGMVSIPFEDQAPSGAFDAEGHRPVLERSRKVR